MPETEAERLSQYKQKRVPEGEEEIPADRYLTAREQMRGMQAYSTAQNRLLSAGETNVEANWTELGPGNIGGRTRAMVIHPADSNTCLRQLRRAVSGRRRMVAQAGSH